MIRRPAATTISGSARRPARLQPQPVHLQLALVLGLRRRILTDFCCHIVDLVHWAMEVEAPGPYRAGRPVRPRRQRRNARYPRGRLRIREEAARIFSWSGAIPTPTPTGSKTWAWASCSREPREPSSPTTARTKSFRRRAGPSRNRRRRCPLGGPSSRVAQCHQDPRPVLVPLRLRPPPGVGGPSGEHRPLTGEKLKWDAAAETILNHPAANRWLTKEYRAAVGVTGGLKDDRGQIPTEMVFHQTRSGGSHPRPRGSDD